MIVSRTPFRISFAGGGTDFPDFYRECGGSVVSTTINKYVYLSMLPLFNKDGYHLKYFDNEITDNVFRIKHPIIREVFIEHNINGVDFSSSSDVPSGTGLGSSSSFTAGLINLCYAYNGHYNQDKIQIAQDACGVEIGRIGSPIGKQDQWACSVGGFNHIIFNKDDSVSVMPIGLHHEKKKQLEQSMMLFYVGNVRTAESVLSEQKRNVRNNFVTLNKIAKLANDLAHDLNNDNIDNFGNILHEGWQLKRELSSNVSNKHIDDLYDFAIRNGAVGGKLLGAGAGGFLLLYAPNGLSVRLGLYQMPFKFESSGTTIMCTSE